MGGRCFGRYSFRLFYLANQFVAHGFIASPSSKSRINHTLVLPNAMEGCECLPAGRKHSGWYASIKLVEARGSLPLRSPDFISQAAIRSWCFRMKSNPWLGLFSVLVRILVKYLQMENSPCFLMQYLKNSLDFLKGCLIVVICVYKRSRVWRD